MQHSLKRHLVWPLLIVLSGLAAHVVFDQNTFASSLWPPAGIAVAAYILCGRAVLPFIFFGAVLASLVSNHLAPGLWLAPINGLALCTQAIVAGVFSKGILSSFRVKKDGEVLLWLFKVGPLASGLSALIAGTGQGLVSNQFVFAEYVQAWVGYTLGVLLFAPVVLILTRNAKARMAERQDIVRAMVMIAVLLAALVIVNAKALLAVDQHLLAFRALLVVATLGAMGAILGSLGRTVSVVRTMHQRAVRLEERLRQQTIAEKSMRQTQRDLNTTLQALGDAVITTDREGRVLNVNPVAEELTGWHQAQAIGEPAALVFYLAGQCDADLLAPHPLETALHSQATVRSEKPAHLVSRSGVKKPVSFVATPLFDENQKLRGAVLVFHDLSAEEVHRLKNLEDEQTLRQIIDLTPNALVIVRGDIIEFANPRALRLLGLNWEGASVRVVGTPLGNWMCQADLETLAIYRATDTGHGGRGEINLLLRRFDGLETPVRVIVTPLDQRGERELLVLKNITEENRSQWELDNFFKLSLDPLCVVDISGYFLRVNEAFTRTLGWSAQELTSKPFLQFIHKDDLDNTLQELQRLANGQLAEGYLNRYVCKDGTYRWLEWKALLAGNGIVYAAARDCTRRMAAAEQLQSLNASLAREVRLKEFAYQRMKAKDDQLTAALESLVEGVMCVNSQGRIELVNSATSKILGHPQADMINTPVADYLDMFDFSSVLRQKAATNRQEESPSFLIRTEMHGKDIDGQQVPVDLTITSYRMLDEDYFVFSLRDIRTQNAMIAALREAREKAEVANTAKSAFLAAMSHEIRTPMNGVLGLVEVLDHTNLSRYQKDLIRTVRTSSNKLLRIIDNVLDFTKIESEHLELLQAENDLTLLIEDVCASMAPVAANAEVSLLLYIDKTASLNVLVDELRLSQILFNLIGNAIKFSSASADKKGLVHVCVKVHNDHQLELAIGDNGVGIAQDKLGVIFDPFVQAEQTRVRRYGGTGLGLTISKRLSELMGGTIQVQSTVQKGSVFTVRLPLSVLGEISLYRAAELHGLHSALIEGANMEVNVVKPYLEDAGVKVSVFSVEAAKSRPDLLSTCGLVLNCSDEDVLDRDDKIPMIRFHDNPQPQSQNTLIRTLCSNALRRRELIQVAADILGFAQNGVTSEPAFDEQSNDFLMALKQSERDRGAASRLLVVEDDPVNARVIVEQLNLLGYRVDVATSGVEAIEQWNGGRYAGVLTDLHMPGMSGYDVARQIRQLSTGKDKPILALTADVGWNVDDPAGKCDFNGVLLKPVPLVILMRAMERWFGPGKESPVHMVQSAHTSEASVLFSPNKSMYFGGATSQEFTGILNVYLESMAGFFKTLREETSAGRPEAIFNICHRLKSSSGAVGALALVDLCVELSSSIQANASGLDQGQIAKLMATMEKTRQEIESYLGSLQEAQE